jgi:phage terminase large subunit-like protein
VMFTLKTVDASVPVAPIHASRGKYTRAEPIAALYEQRRVRHIGTFPELEDQLCEWMPGGADSPDRLDALVYALSELMLEDYAHWTPGEDDDE